jgi:hypothetical protein
LRGSNVWAAGCAKVSPGGFGLPMMFSALENDLTDSEDDLGDKENMD